MPLVLDSLLNDGRLARLFSQDARDCALQLWVLQIQSEQSVENRIVYGRLLPYSHSNSTWSFSNNDNFEAFGSVKAKVSRLNLYVQSSRCANLVRLLNSGWNISEISEELKLKIPDKLKSRFGTTALVTTDLIYRPVAYLLNRDAYDHRSLSSPHGGAGALSASITQSDKKALFRLGQDYDIDLVRSVVRELNTDTALDFGGIDSQRFGDLELIVFPALDDHERDLLSVNWIETPDTLVARFNPIQIPYFGGFQFRLSIVNDGQIIYSTIATAESNAEKEFECKFELGSQLRSITDSTELEIFGFHNNHSREGVLCCRWQIWYVREIHQQSHVIGNGASPVKFDWLEKATRPSASTRVKAVLTINRGDLGFTNLIGGRKEDPWVPVNRDLKSLFARIHPPKSDGRFFLRWNKGDPEGRLQFVEWFKELLLKHQQHQVIIFDPYFEDAGLGLVLLCAASDSDYIVFTSLPKQVKESEATPAESDKPTPNRIDNLLANCEHSRHLIRRFKLRIYGLKEGQLHDRYILIFGSDGLPVAGFNLSNSLQAAAQYHPLLITPIPNDVLLKVKQYTFGLLQEVAQSDSETESSALRLLFDSALSPTVLRCYEPLQFLEKPLAGDVLSIWCREASLHGLSGDPLKERMTALGLIKDNSLALPLTSNLSNFLDQKADDFVDFTETWEILGEVLAHSRTEERNFHELESKQIFLEFLARFLNASFSRVHDEEDREFAVVGSQFFREPLETLLHSSYHPQHLFHGTKYLALSWPEYYATKLLWWYAPDTLCAIAEVQMGSVPIEPQGTDAVRLSLLSQFVSEIALSVQFDISETQQDRLIYSSNGLLQWMGLFAIEKRLEKPDGLTEVLQLLKSFDYLDRVRALGWMVQHKAGNPENTEIYKGLVTALHDALPSTISTSELRHLIDSMRGHMRELAWTEPWLFQDVIFPLLRETRVNTDDACEIWVEDLAGLLGPQPGQPSRLFDRKREGQTTNTAAFLFAYSSSERQQTCLKSIQAILKQQKRVVQLPLASTSNWTRWNDALVVSIWILAFAQWAQYYLRGRGMIDRNLEELSQDARNLALVRPMLEWRSKGGGKQDELAAFLDQVEELLASCEE